MDLLGNVSLPIFAAATSFVLLVAALLGGRRSRTRARLDEITRSGPKGDKGFGMSLAETALPKIGSALAPEDEQRKGRLQTRLTRAGLYSRQAMVVFLGVKFLLMVCPIFLGLAMAATGLMSLEYGVVFGAMVGILGTVAPGLWLDWEKSKRQTELRRALPDALDVAVICLEGGLSLQGAFARVASELHTAHPLLAMEMGIVHREIQLGRSTGEALRELANRFDLDEVRSLASVILQAERFGASVTKAMKVHADALREKRRQRAEELAQKAGTKMVFPTVLCIFPAMFIVLVGPAFIQVFQMFANMAN